MRLLSRNADYAVNALCYMSRISKDRIVSVTELVRHLKMPRPFLRKILQVLNNRGILRSHRGAGGGFRLARKPRDIYLIDIMEAFQGTVRLNECLFRKNVCPNIKTCFLKKKLSGIEKHALSELGAITIDSIIKPFDPSTLRQAQGRPEQGRRTTGSVSSRAKSRDDKSSGFYPERRRGIKGE